MLYYMILFIFLCLFTGDNTAAETLPEWFIPLREVIYEQQLTAAEIEPLYREISDKAKTALSGDTQYIILSRSEYMMGRAYQFENKKNEAISHYDEGIKWAEKALEVRESAEAWVILAENISQSCAVRPASYAMANGLKVEKYAKNALAIDSKNAAAQFMIAARWVFAPFPLNNYNKGIEMLNAIPVSSNMEKDDMFNVYSSLCYVYKQRKNNVQALIWYSKANEIYPTNKYLKSLNVN
jgi:tetratricopeptide (TPR) repeat protein